jgi:hypothetical protein
LSYFKLEWRKIRSTTQFWLNWKKQDDEGQDDQVPHDKEYRGFEVSEIGEDSDATD